MSSYKNYFIIIYAYALGSSFVEAQPDNRGSSSVDLTLRLGSSTEATDTKYTECTSSLFSASYLGDLYSLKNMFNKLSDGVEVDKYIENILRYGGLPIEEMKKKCSENYSYYSSIQYCRYLLSSLSQITMDGARVHCYNKYYYTQNQPSSSRGKGFDVNDNNFQKCVENLTSAGFTTEDGQLNFIIAVSKFVDYKNDFSIRGLEKRNILGSTTEILEYINYLNSIGGNYVTTLDNNYVFCCLEELRFVGFIEDNVEFYYFFRVLGAYRKCREIPRIKARDYCYHVSEYVKAIDTRGITVLSPRNWCSNIV